MSGLAAFRRVASPIFAVAPQKSSEKALGRRRFSWLNYSIMYWGIPSKFGLMP